MPVAPLVCLTQWHNDDMADPDANFLVARGTPVELRRRIGLDEAHLGELAHQGIGLPSHPGATAHPRHRSATAHRRALTGTPCFAHIAKRSPPHLAARARSHACEAEPMTESSPPSWGSAAIPPLPPRRPRELVAHGDVRVDDWWWLRERDNPEVIAHLEAENRYADAVLAPTLDLQQRLFEQIKGRIEEDDLSVPARDGSWWYWSETATGRQYRTYHRLHDPEGTLDPVAALAAARAGSGEVILDENILAGDSDYFALGVFDLSSDHRLLAYATDLDGSEQYRLRVRDLETGDELPEVIEGVVYGSAWDAHSTTLFYVRPDEAMRPHQIWAHVLGTDVTDDRLVFHEPDERFAISVGRTRSERFILIHSSSRMTSEVLAIDAGSPSDPPTPVLARRSGVEYDVEHAVLAGTGDVWLVLTNAPGENGELTTNFALVVVPVGSSEPTEVLIAHRPDVKLESVDAFSTHLVVVERAEGLERLRLLMLDDRSEKVIEQPEPVYALTGAGNAQWEATTYRFGYTSLVAPVSTVEVDVATLERRVIKSQRVLGGYQPGDYRSERIWATAPDGTQIPISLVCKADLALDGSAACLLYGYGSYEITIDPTFSAARLNLLERGVVFAIAHVRGGGEMGRIWYEQGRLDHKANTFTDFVACARHLVDERYTSASRLVARGGSAGGLLVGAATNLAPEMFAAVVAEVPFVDVVTTMSDESLPLTVGEWEEWGNPVADAQAYATMKSYSPYDNVRAVDYPAMFVTAGLNDPRVGYFEPAKWVAKLRASTTGVRPIVLRTELGAGHQGQSGRYDAWRDEARVQAFVLWSVGITT